MEKNSFSGPSFTISMKLDAMSCLGGIKPSFDFKELQNTLQIIMKVLPFLKVGVRWLSRYSSPKFHQSLIWREFFPISKVNSSVQIILFHYSIIHFLYSIANWRWALRCLLVKNGFFQALQLWILTFFSARQTVEAWTLVGLAFVIS